MTMPSTPHDAAQRLLQECKAADLNEADTRHKIIDVIIHDVLSWPRSLVSCEEYIQPGYADYVLLGRRESKILFIEAKREGVYFSLPAAMAQDDSHRYVQVKTLLTAADTRAAIEQVREYCLNKGCDHAAITNGHQWIFFKTYERQKDWRDLHAYVITRLSYFDEKHLEARNCFSYSAIVENASLAELFGDRPEAYRQRFFPKEQIVNYDYEVSANTLSPYFRPIVERYMAKMDAHDWDFMDKCYVDRRSYRATVSGVHQVIFDTLSPYFHNYKVKEFFEDLGGGELGKRISSSARERRTKDVVVMFGGKGSGKSTFINRILYHRPPHEIKHFSTVAVVDLLECPESKEQIDKELWSQLLESLDRDKVLQADRASLLLLFSDKFELAQRQVLTGLDPQGEAYNLKLNDLVQAWLSDKVYCAARLADYWKRRQKGLIVVIDNTDQFTPPNQDYCFTHAHNLATQLDCLVVISMREERFHNSRIHGTLDAFPSSGFHLVSPRPGIVFVKRLRYIRSLLKDRERAKNLSPDLTNERIAKLKTLVNIFLREFENERSTLGRFIQACAHGNMRLALDFFRQFVLSGYLRVSEMIESPGWTLQVHQVLQPMMVPYRLFYDEEFSSVPNIYQVRSEVSGSHFTGLRILEFLSRGRASSNHEYVPLAKLRTYFADTFNMLDDLEKNLDVFLKMGVVESNNRVDEYEESIDSLKITAFGEYISKELAHNFSYVVLVCLDCGIHDEAVANSLASLGKQDIDLFLDRRKRERLKSRLNRALEFVEYLEKEEEREREIYSLDTTDKRLMVDIKSRYLKDALRVRKSGSRNVHRKNAAPLPGESGTPTAVESKANGSGNAGEPLRPVDDVPGARPDEEAKGGGAS